MFLLCLIALVNSISIIELKCREIMESNTGLEFTNCKPKFLKGLE